MEDNSDKLLISVLVPVYNAEKYLQSAISSILEQSYRHFELLACDDGSTDDSFAIASSFKDSRITIFRNSKNIGKPRTVNFLYAKSRGEIITIHDADDISFHFRFEEIMKMFRNPGVFVCGHIIERMSENGIPLGLYRPKTSNHAEIREKMRFDNTDGDPSLFFRREVADELKGELIRPYFPNNMDYDMALRMIEKFPFTNVLEVLSYYRNVPNSISKGINSYKKMATQQMTKFFATEREEKGTDSLLDGNWNLIRKKQKEFAEPYLLDKTLYLREMASFYMYTKMNRFAIRNMVRAVVLEPRRWINWRTLQYCLRKSIFGI